MKPNEKLGTIIAAIVMILGVCAIAYLGFLAGLESRRTSQKIEYIIRIQ